MSNMVLSSSVAALIAADVANVEKSSKSRYAAVDAMVAAGIKWYDFVSPKGKDKRPGVNCASSPELYAALRATIPMGFSAADRQLLAVTSPAAIAALKPEKAARRTYVQQQIGSRMSEYKIALKRREESGGAVGKKRPAMDRLLDHLGKALSVLKTESDFAFEVAPMVERLTKEVALVTLAMKAK